jgi:hypothetical protein
MKKTWDNFFVHKREFCALNIDIDVTDGDLSGAEAISFELPARLTSISSVKGSKNNSEGFEYIIKGHSLGDFEDVHEIVVPTIRANWSEIGQKTPSNALAYIRKIEQETSDKRKTRIELLGQSVDAALSLIAGSIVLLALVVFLYLSISHARSISRGKEQQIKEFPFTGLMWTRWGGAFMSCTILILPVSVSYLCLMHVAPSSADGVLRQWQGSISRLVLVILIAAMGIQTLVVLRKLFVEVEERQIRKTYLRNDTRVPD